MLALPHFYGICPENKIRHIKFDAIKHYVITCYRIYLATGNTTLYKKKAESIVKIKQEITM